MKKSKVKLGEIDFVLFATILMLVSIGVVMVYSASSYFASFQYNNAEYFLWRQLMWAGLGTFGMIITMNIDYHKYKRHTGKLMILTIIALLLVFLFPPVKGAQRWIRLGPASFQPSEIAKYTVVLFTAMSVERKGEKIKSFTKGVLPYLLISGFYAGLVIAEKNLSIATVIMIVTVGMLFIAGTKLRFIGGLVGGLVGLVGLAITLEPYRMRRITGFLDPWSDAQDTGYQLIQSLLALGSGGLTGVGIGQSRQKCFYIPEPHNDFIFAVIGEELGFIGCMFIITLFIIFLWRGLRAAVQAKDVYGSLLATGITAVVIVQALINVAVVTVSMPTTGVPLPFISSGGSSLVINMMAMGILLNITRQNAYSGN